MSKYAPPSAPYRHAGGTTFGSALALALAAALGCTGEISDKGEPPGTSPAGTAPLCSGGGKAPAPIAARVRRLTRIEVESTLMELLGAEAAARVSALEPDSRASGYSTGAERTVTAGFAGSLKTLAEATATAFRSTVKSPKFATTCFASDAAARACADTFVRDFGARAYRHPVAAEDATALLAVYDAGRATGIDGNVTDRFAAGLEYTVRAILQAPDFIYRTEIGPTAAAPGSTATLTAHETASALSYTLLAGPPDAELMRAAGANQLGTAAELTAQARRLMTEHADRFGPQLREFVIEWLGLGLGGPQWQKDTTLFPSFSADTKAALAEETTLFIDDWVAGGSLLPGLLTSSDTFLSARNASLYGMSVSATTFAKTPLDPTRRAGILTQPAFLGTYAHTDASSPVFRGVAVMRRLLCDEPPPVPANIPPLPPPDMAAPKTTRARFAAHTQVSGCSFCHQQFDPMGNAFEAYDALGAFRTEENGETVDTSGAIVGSSNDQPVANAVELARALAASPDVHACVARHLYRFGLGRQEASDEACTIQQYTKAYSERGLDLRELFISIIASPAFNRRAVPTDAPGAGQ